MRTSAPVQRVIRLLLLGAALGAGSCSSPSKPSPPVDQFPNGPRISCPVAPPATTSSSGQPLSISYGAATTTGGAPPLNVVCAPESGTAFRVGTTAVTCTVTDSRQRTDTCSFNVVVTTPPRIQLTRYMAFGDSITWGENGISTVAFGVPDALRPHFQVAVTYPTVVYQSLALRYTAQSIVVGNFGERGEYASSGDTRARFSSLVRSGSWDVALLMEGSNDLGDGLASAAISSLATMVREAKSRGVRPFLATIPPMNGLSCCPRRGSAAPLVPGFNDQIRTLAAFENIPLVDVYAALNASPGTYIGNDGLHPNDAGYLKIGETFFDAIRTALEVKQTTTALGADPQAILPGRPVRRRP